MKLYGKKLLARLSAETKAINNIKTTTYAAIRLAIIEKTGNGVSEHSLRKLNVEDSTPEARLQKTYAKFLGIDINEIALKKYQQKITLKIDPLNFNHQRMMFALTPLVDWTAYDLDKRKKNAPVTASTK